MYLPSSIRNLETWGSSSCDQQCQPKLLRSIYLSGRDGPWLYTYSWQSAVDFWLWIWTIPSWSICHLWSQVTESRPPFKTEQAAGVMRVLGTNSKSLDRLSGLTTHVEKKIPSLKYKNYSVSVEQLNFQSLLSHSIETIITCSWCAKLLCENKIS